MSKQYYVYIMASKSRVLYVGVTNNLQRRVEQHKQKLVEGFTHKYNITRLVYYEMTGDVHAAHWPGKSKSKAGAGVKRSS